MGKIKMSPQRDECRAIFPYWAIMQRESPRLPRQIPPQPSKLRYFTDIKTWHHLNLYAARPHVNVKIVKGLHFIYQHHAFLPDSACCRPQIGHAVLPPPVPIPREAEVNNPERCRCVSGVQTLVVVVVRLERVSTMALSVICLFVPFCWAANINKISGQRWWVGRNTAH